MCADDVGEDDRIFGRPQLIFYTLVNLGRSRARCFADQAIPAVTTSVTTSKPGDNIQASFEFCGVGVEMSHTDSTCSNRTELEHAIIAYSRGREKFPTRTRGGCSRFGIIAPDLISLACTQARV